MHHMLHKYRALHEEEGMTGGQGKDADGGEERERRGEKWRWRRGEEEEG